MREGGAGVAQRVEWLAAGVGGGGFEGGRRRAAPWRSSAGPHLPQSASMAGGDGVAVQRREPDLGTEARVSRSASPSASPPGRARPRRGLSRRAAAAPRPGRRPRSTGKSRAPARRKCPAAARAASAAAAGAGDRQPVAQIGQRAPRERLSSAARRAARLRGSKRPPGGGGAEPVEVDAAGDIQTAERAGGPRRAPGRERAPRLDSLPASAQLANTSSAASAPGRGTCWCLDPRAGPPLRQRVARARRGDGPMSAGLSADGLAPAAARAWPRCRRSRGPARVLDRR